MNYLSHYGILGQKWGVRRYQNPDGTLTKAGQKRYRKAIESTPMDSTDFDPRSQYGPKIAKEMYKQAVSSKEYKEAVRKLSTFEKFDVDDEARELRNTYDIKYPELASIMNKYMSDILPYEKDTAVETLLKSVLSMQVYDGNPYGYSLVEEVYNANLDSEVSKIQKKLFGKNIQNDELSRALKESINDDAYYLRADRRSKAERVPFMNSEHYNEYLKERDAFYAKQKGADADPSVLDEAATVDWDIYKQWLTSKNYKIPTV